MRLKDDTVYFSYFGFFNKREVRDLDVENRRVSVARKTYGFKGNTATQLLVPEDLFNSYKSGEISLNDLKMKYFREVLMKLDPKEIFNTYKGNILLCHEIEGCHREVINLWLKAQGYKTKELTLGDLYEC